MVLVQAGRSDKAGGSGTLALQGPLVLQLSGSCSTCEMGTILILWCHLEVTRGPMCKELGKCPAQLGRRSGLHNGSR